MTITTVFVPLDGSDRAEAALRPVVGDARISLFERELDRRQVLAAVQGEDAEA